ncbi:unnamed protein product [Adineta steineri]|uniref:Uncharacterized protein n=1 Tax=Adineta steineri TaxID=433720 RepID=A0A816DUD2_9BILA|nr:unnamed protein product [Adineta steineri]CAF1483377.1 unnamed protein product [Adineta steineri]CAF1639191.1 unnamed protein product [Adineta steineri]CAF1639205.1 unnamed protein product [Adineta steineri]
MFAINITVARSTSKIPSEVVLGEYPCAKDSVFFWTYILNHQQLGDVNSMIIEEDLSDDTGSIVKDVDDVESQSASGQIDNDKKTVKHN